VKKTKLPPVREFYIGYESPMPPRLAARTKRVAGVLLVMGVAAAAVVVAGLRPLPPSRFDFGRPQPFEGWVSDWPYPLLIRDGAGEGAGAELLLVAAGKHGASDLVRPFDGRRVRLQGMLIARGDESMIEIVEGTIEPVVPAGDRRPPTPSATSHGVHVLRGEIVDSKCFLGVMNPGERAVHRDCAIRCISGGVPPALVVRAPDGQERVLRLVSETGAPLGRELLDLVAVPVEVRGEVVQTSSGWWLRADPSRYRRWRG
jgi:hypothetical protein